MFTVLLYCVQENWRSFGCHIRSKWKNGWRNTEKTGISVMLFFKYFKVSACYILWAASLEKAQTSLYRRWWRFLELGTHYLIPQHGSMLITFLTGLIEELSDDCFNGLQCWSRIGSWVSKIKVAAEESGLSLEGQTVIWELGASASLFEMANTFMSTSPFFAANRNLEEVQWASVLLITNLTSLHYYRNSSLLYIFTPVEKSTAKCCLSERRCNNKVDYHSQLSISVWQFLASADEYTHKNSRHGSMLNNPNTNQAR